MRCSRTTFPLPLRRDSERVVSPNAGAGDLRVMSAATLWLRMEPAISLPGLAFPAFSLTAAFLLFLLPNPELPSPHLFLHECGVLSGLQHNTPAFGIFTMVEGFHGLLLRNDFGPGSNFWSPRGATPL